MGSETPSTSATSDTSESQQEAHLDHLRPARLRLRQAVQGLIQRDGIDHIGLPAFDHVMQRHLDPAIALDRVTRARVVHEDPAHGERGRAQEVCAVLEAERFGAQQAQGDLIDQRRRLERVVRTFVSHMAAGDRLELGVDGPEEAVARQIIALPGVLEQPSDAHRSRGIGGHRGLSLPSTGETPPAITRGLRAEGVWVP